MRLRQSDLRMMQQGQPAMLHRCEHCYYFPDRLRTNGYAGPRFGQRAAVITQCDAYAGVHAAMLRVMLLIAICNTALLVLKAFRSHISTCIHRATLHTLCSLARFEA